MPDLKITEMTELLDSGSGDGINDSDFVVIVDQSEGDLTQANKKVRIFTLLEFVARLDSPTFTGTPRAPLPPVADNSTRLATTEWVQSELSTSLTLNSLSDVSLPSTPQANQILVFNDLTGTFQAQSPTTVNREILTATKTLTSASALYQFLDPNGANRDVVLPAALVGLRYVIKNIDTANTLSIKETAGGPVQATLTVGSPIAEAVHDGTEWHILVF